MSNNINNISASSLSSIHVKICVRLRNSLLLFRSNEENKLKQVPFEIIYVFFELGKSHSTVMRIIKELNKLLRGILC